MHDFEDVYDALRAAVAALGGAKKVGPRIRPEASDAAQWLRNCLNREHAQNLNPAQHLLIMRWACEAGYHDARHFIDREQGYQSAVPLQTESHLASVLKQLEADRRRQDETVAHLRDFLDNPKLLATLRAHGVNVDALA